MSEAMIETQQQAVDPILLTYEQASRALSMSVRALQRLVAAEQIPVVRPAGGWAVRFRRQDLEAWARSLASEGRGHDRQKTPRLRGPKPRLARGRRRA